MKMKLRNKLSNVSSLRTNGDVFILSHVRCQGKL